MIRDSLKSMISEVFPEGSEEYETLLEVYQSTSQAIPATAAEAKVRMVIYDRLKVKLSTLLFNLSREQSRLQSTVQSTRDSQYTRLVKLGRPTKDAIEAEIRTTNPEYAGIMIKVNFYEDIKNLILTYLRCIDSQKTTALELLRNINRID